MLGISNMNYVEGYGVWYWPLGSKLSFEEQKQKLKAICGGAIRPLATYLRAAFYTRKEPCSISAEIIAGRSAISAP